MSQYKRLARSLLLIETGFLIAIIILVPLGTGYLYYTKEPPITNFGLNFKESEVFQMKIHTMEINFEITGNITNIMMIEQGLYYDNYLPTLNNHEYKGLKMPLYNFSGNSVSNQILDFEVTKIDYKSTLYGIDGKTVDVATILIIDRGTSLIIPAHSDMARSPVSIDFRVEINDKYLFERVARVHIFDSENSRNAFNQMVKELVVNIRPQEKINQNKFIYPSESIREERYGESIYSWAPYINWTFYPDSSRFKFVDYVIHEKNRSITIDGEIFNYTFYVNLEIEWIYPEMKA